MLRGCYKFGSEKSVWLWSLLKVSSAAVVSVDQSLRAYSVIEDVGADIQLSFFVSHVLLNCD